MDLFLRQAQKNGLKVALGLEQYLEKELPWHRIEEVITRFKNHPALLCWYVIDEPEDERHSMTPEYIDALCERVRIADPYHPTMVLTMPSPKTYYEWAHIPDIFATDIYPHNSRKPCTWISTVTDIAKRATRNKKPLWIVLQSMKWDEKPAPTPIELRCMTYLAVNHGANGIWYFRYHDPKEREAKSQSPALLEAMRNLGGELHSLTPVFLHGNTDTSRLVTDRATIDLSVKKYGGKTYAIAVNTLDRSSHVEFTLEWSSSEVSVLFESRTIRPVKNRFLDTFDPYDVHIYVME